MKKISESEKWNLKTGDFVIQTDVQRSFFSLMKVTKVGDTGIIFDLVKTLFENRSKIFDYEHAEIYQLENGDILDIRMSNESNVTRDGRAGA